MVEMNGNKNRISTTIPLQFHAHTHAQLAHDLIFR